MKKVLIGLVVAAALVELTLLVFYNPAETNFFPSCLFRRITGLPCPGCGLQRSVHLLLHGHLLASLRMCPFVYFLGLVLASMKLFPKATESLVFAVAVAICTFTYSVARLAGVVP